MLPLPRLNFTGKPDAAMSCLSGLEGAGRKRTSTMVQRVALRPYLNPFDHFVKRTLRCQGYQRYVDDFLLFADDKETLWQWKSEVVDWLAKLRLTIHPAVHPRPVTEGVSFLGFIVFPERRRLKRRKGVHYQRRLNKLIMAYQQGEISLAQLTASVQGWVNHACYGNTIGLRKAILSQTSVPPPLTPNPRKEEADEF